MLVQGESYFLRKGFIKANTDPITPEIQDYLDHRHDEPAGEAFIENQEFFGAIKAIFDESFGPGDIEMGARAHQLVFAGHLQYHPRRHFARKMRREAARLNYDAVELEKGRGLEDSEERSEMARDLMQALTI